MVHATANQAFGPQSRTVHLSATDKLHFATKLECPRFKTTYAMSMSKTCPFWGGVVDFCKNKYAP
eukprot:1158667-Pelagomonas_calceolata.AAC.2